MSKSKFEVIFETGRLRYEKKTGQQLDVTLVASLTTVADLRDYVERQNGQFDAFRNKNKSIFNGLNSAFAPTERFGHSVAVGTLVGFPPAGACFGASASMIWYVKNVEIRTYLNAGTTITPWFAKSCSQVCRVSCIASSLTISFVLLHVFLG
jgi:hypothetical protein